MRRFVYALAFAAFAAPAGAETHWGNPIYVGGSVFWAKADTDSSLSLKDSNIGYGGLAGIRLMEYVGVEASYETWWTSNKVQGAAEQTGTFFRDCTWRTFAADLYGYYPLGNRGWFQPFVTLGAGYTGIHARSAREWNEPQMNEDGSPKLDDSHNPVTVFRRDISDVLSNRGVHLRAGAGLEWSMGHYVAGRLTARYQPYGFDAMASGMTVTASLLLRVDN